MNSNLPDQLAVDLRRNPCDRARRRQLAAELSFGRQFGPPSPSARQAAVMILLYPKEGEWHIPLTLRPLQLGAHGGQISLPGGLIEPGETSEQASLRELDEELGTTRGVQVLAALAELYVYVTNYRVTPWVGIVAERPHWQPNSVEVEELLEVPLRELLDREPPKTFLVQRGPLAFSAPYFEWHGRKIWGATAMILSDLLGRVREIGY
jgi:8-oxo-dGTP pyrophosphatase MutT (NUDIX family)